MKGRAADGRGRKGRKTEMMAEAFRQIRQLTKHGAKTWRFQTENIFLFSFFDLQMISYRQHWVQWSDKPQPGLAKVLSRTFCS